MSRLDPDRLARIAVLLGSLAALVAWGSVDAFAPAHRDWDLHQYLAMAKAFPALDSAVERPFAYRLLGPALVGLLPFDEQTGFRLLTGAANLLLPLLLYGFLRRHAIGPATAATMSVLFALNKYALGLTSWNHFQLNDALGSIALLLAFDALHARRWSAFAAVLLLGVLAREATVLMVPAAVAFLWQQRASKREFGRLVAAVAPALMVLVLVRAVVPSQDGPALLEALGLHAGKLLTPTSLTRLLVNAFAPVTLVPLVFAGLTIAFLRERLHLVVFVALVVASTLFGSNDERLMAPAFVAFYLLLAHVLEHGLNGRHRLGLLATCVVGGVAASLHHTIARWPLPSREATVMLTAASLLFVTATAIAARIASRRRTDEVLAAAPEA